MAEESRPSRSSKVVGFADFTVDLRAGILCRNGAKVRLQEQPFQVLALLTEHAGELVSRDQLRFHLWPADTFVDFDNSLNATVAKIREALGDSPESPRFIETLPRRGYRFIAPVEELPSSAFLVKSQRTVLATPATWARGRWWVAALQGDTELDATNEVTAQSRRTMMIIAGSALVLTALIACVWLYLARTRVRTDSIAVLPFVNTSGDLTVEYLSDGITEGVIHNLSQLPQLRVMARTTVFYYKGRDIDPRKVGRDLNVRAVLIGTVVQRGSMLNVETELVDVSSGMEMWGEKYDRRLSDAYIIEEQIAEDISEKLKIRLSRDEKQRLIKPATESGEAYELYLKGRYYWNKRTEDGLNKARDYFNQAISVDPKYALAYAGLADDYLIQGEDGFALPADAFSKAKAAALKAIEGDDNLAEAHTSLADVKAVYDWDWSGAEKEFRRAIELNSNYGTAHQWYAEDVLMRLGRFEEAVAEIKRAKAVDPLSLIINSVECEVLAFAGDYDNAIKQGHKTIELDPNFPDGHFELGRAYEYKGMYNEAIREFQKAEPLRAAGEPELVGHAHAKMGDRASALAALGGLEELEKAQGGTSFGQALIYAALGDKDRAFRHLQQAYEQHNYWIPTIKTDPRFGDLRSDPRFADLLHRMGLPE